MRSISFIYICITVFSFHCERISSSSKSSYNREKNLIDDYHKQVVILKADKTFYIPKTEIEWYFDKKKFKPISNAKMRDNISVFDTLGNIVYQMTVDTIINNKIIVVCLNLRNAEYYKTVLFVDNIKDLDINYPYLFLCYPSDEPIIDK